SSPIQRLAELRLCQRCVELPPGFGAVEPPPRTAGHGLERPRLTDQPGIVRPALDPPRQSPQPGIDLALLDTPLRLDRLRPGEARAQPAELRPDRLLPGPQADTCIQGAHDPGV